MEGEKSIITAIIDPAAHTGIGKNGKPWTQAMVELENGAQVRIFMPIKVGDKVESYKNGDYINWRIVKQDKADQAEVLKMIQLIYDDVQLIKEKVGIETTDGSISMEDL